jgi:class 3 adenylate cyclase/pimeloyl-ACP methyl ester carboxylesterase
MDVPVTQYAKSGHLSIAYQAVGDGPIDVVFIPGFVSHLEVAWELFPSRRMWERLAAFSRLIVFDKRGTGLSDRTERLPTLEERMDDVRAVMDASGCQRAAFVAPSGGGPMALLFAATYPERTSALVLWASFARRVRAPGYPFGVDADRAESTLRQVEQAWGSGDVFRAVAFQDAPADAATQRLFARAERNSATPGLAVAALQFAFQSDVRHVLSSISAPTLVLHRVGDPMVPVGCGRYLADHIGSAKLIELPGNFHLSATGRDDNMLDAIEEFLTGHRHVPEFDCVLKTVLFTDIVGSTERAAQLKDRQWTDLLDAHNALVREELERFQGQEIDTAGDGFLAAFDGPARAITAAQAIRSRARGIGLELRAGLHSGECEVRGERLAGMTLHIGARVAALSGPGEVLVTSTVRDLVIGERFEFEDRGSHELKGVPGEWQVLAVRG